MTSLVDILSQIPTSLVGRAKPILDTMLVSRHLLRWDRNLELVIKDNVVPDTNVPELIVHALQPISRGDNAPNGFPEFIACLRLLGLESEYVENEYAEQVLEDRLDSSDSDSSDSDADSDNNANPDENPDEDNVEGESGELESDNENIDGDEELSEQTGEMDQKVQWLQMEDGEGGEGEEDNADVEEVEGNQKVEWLEVDDGDGDIYINSDGYYKRV